ncbi:TnsA endonuclease N-terminal domain-containing protein [Pseudomonas moorei]|uniref:TnsA endonuclease N terminal n=1 Tax=Pseudomonas moorei TaxID=395599 RepID=A0A1H1I3V6_9PSED|nr:TnsA endonuclease N-terminal domain-containing protein [Pseudomonas moorei]KAB0501388.1 transposase [Pseudomonas moorei]SDR32415.1 TnsA endonuclease N terminal [Pseudomonas moorei]
MAGSKSRMPSVQTVEGWIRAGFGQGDGAKYKPFLYVRDVPSSGTSCMIKSRTTNRTHHYLSKQEFKTHLLTEYQADTIDIREQYALLPWNETQLISQSLGIRHPIYPGTNTPIVMTTDLLVSMQRTDGTELIALSVKLTKDLGPRNLEKLLIERSYWERRGICWSLVTEKNTPKYLPENLQFFEASLHDERVTASVVTPLEFTKEFEKNWADSLSFNQIMALTSKQMDLDVATGHSLLGVSVWRHQSRLDIANSVISHRGFVKLQPSAVNKHDYI